jgi:hypothetical protein
MAVDDSLHTLDNLRQVWGSVNLLGYRVFSMSPAFLRYGWMRLPRRCVDTNTSLARRGLAERNMSQSEQVEL